MALSKILPASQEQYAGARNLIINGAMQVAQRGTSATALGNGNTGYHTVDRWRFTEAGSGTFEFTMSQSTTAPEGFASSTKLNCTIAQASLDSNLQLRLMQRIEGQNVQQLKFGTSSAESLTISFWVRSNLTGTYVVHIFLEDDSSTASKTYTIDTANTWEHKTITFSGDQTSVIDNDNGNGVQVSFYLLSGTDYTSGTPNTEFSDSATSVDRAAGQTANLASSTSNEWYITGVQLEVGEQATPFEHRSYADELARCQRYAQLIGLGGLGRWSSGTVCEIFYNQWTPMRSSPSATLQTTTLYMFAVGINAADATGCSISFSTLNYTGGAFGVAKTGGISVSAGQFAALMENDCILLDAEL